MLEGLDISVKKFSETSNDGDGTLRLDAEHYQSKYEKIEEKIAKSEFCTLRELLVSPVITGHTPSMKIDRFYSGDICFVKTDNVRENKIVAPFTDYLTEAGNADVSNSQLAAGDIVLTIIGATFDVVGRSAIVRDSHLPANINQNIALIRPDKTKINPNYLSAYLNTKYGRGTLHHHSRQTEQVNLNCREVERISVPLFRQLEISVSSTSRAADATAAEAALAFTQAEVLLLEELGIGGFSASNAGVNVKSLKETFGITGRLDAEHYQPKYEALHKALSASNKVFRLGDRLSFNQRGSQPDYAESGLQVINSKHVQRGEVLIDDTRFAALPDKDNAVFIEQGDVLMNGTGVGTIGRAAPYLHKQRALPDNHVTVLRTDAMSPICLALYLNSIAGQMQVEQHFKGSSGQIELYPADIANFWCPEIKKATQKKIEALAQSSFELKAKSERLLEAAKRAVEIAIEQDEAAGMAYLARENSTE